jgi:hypothetical protein
MTLLIVRLTIAFLAACVAGCNSSSDSGSPAADTLAQQAALNECATLKTGWVWCDDFEQDRLNRYFEYTARNGSYVRQSTIGRNASTGMRARWQNGQVDAGALHLAFGKTPQSYFRAVDAGTAQYRDLYWRLYLRNQNGWIGGGGDKLSRAIVFASTSTWAEAAIAHVWSGGANSSSFLVIDPASGTDAQGMLLTTGYNDFAHFRWLGSARSNTPVFDAAHINQWHCIETHAKLNSAGQSDGVFELWIDGQLEARKTGLNWLGNFNAYGWNSLFIENYWNNGSPAVQERYLDNLVVSTQRIGC